MTLPARPWLVAAALLFLATIANAQPLAGTGCAGAAPVVGPPAIKTPGSAVFGCPVSAPGAGVLLIGIIGPSVAVPMPPACAPGPCVLGCTVIITVAVPTNGLTINVPSAVAITPICLQCVAIDAAAPCVWLSMAVKMQIFPC